MKSIYEKGDFSKVRPGVRRIYEIFRHTAAKFSKFGLLASHKAGYLWIFLALFCKAALFLWGCSHEEQKTKPELLTVTSWNVHNLFDGTDNGFEYAEFKHSAGWNSEKYHARLHGITAALKGETGIRPDILALMEIENAAVINDLADKSFLDYQWTFFANIPESSIGLGILSDLPITETRVHSIYSNNGSIPRPVAEVWIDTGSGPLVLLACHWKSKREGADKTAMTRKAAAAVIARRLTEIEAESPGTPVVILGDLNESFDEFDKIEGEYLCALLPDTEKASALIQKTAAGLRPEARNFLVLSGRKPPSSDYFSGPIVFSPWLETDEYNGSYYYKDDWAAIDHFLLSSALFSGKSWNYDHFRVLTEPPFANEDGIPHLYNPRTGSGLSDHLPIVLFLNRIGE